MANYNTDSICMWLFAILQILLSIADVIVSALNHRTVKDRALLNQTPDWRTRFLHCSTATIVLMSFSIFSAVFTMFYYTAIRKQLKDIDFGKQQECHRPVDSAFRSDGRKWGTDPNKKVSIFPEFFVILLGALSFIGMVYATGIRNILVWFPHEIAGDEKYDAVDLEESVKASLALTASALACSVITLIIGHCWSIARSKCHLSQD